MKSRNMPDWLVAHLVSIARAGGDAASGASAPTEPAKALEAGLSFTPSARIDHTYLPNDFTLYLYKTPAWRQETEG